MEISRQMKIPRAMISNGYIRLEMKCEQPPTPTRVVEEITRAAHVLSAKEPNKSALMPATSPTLSPTLSAIVAGFLGLSYGRPA